ncbi:estradiol 17-beta-dehydrogenase 8 [Hyposmocoma kahamanoa]|uniref:estradiol 17-beta-dehydrogenase 8 n=1 Tax=Hyposmocoma kahamanoa TaxID=1477025 RepID=UPI000E6DA193|nr:estradiol 17-beta-dehydrogenase 8 [Hyposmocoma kahamanoa]
MVTGIVAGRLALVTGAGSGIGRAACQVLSREGATVIAADLNYDSAMETIKTIPLASGANAVGDHSAIELEVSQSASVQKALDTAMEHYKAPPTIIVNSAGIVRDNWLLKMSEEDFDKVVAVNLKGTFLVMQTFAKALTAASLPGSIINISSIVGKYGNMGQVNYVGSKAGVVGMSRVAALELGKSNIRVNAILPGFIDTPIIKSVPEKVMKEFLARIPLGRQADPVEVGELITYLASEKSSYVNGAVIDIAGGL